MINAKRKINDSSKNPFLETLFLNFFKNNIMFGKMNIATPVGLVKNINAKYYSNVVGSLILSITAFFIFVFILLVVKLVNSINSFWLS